MTTDPHFTQRARPVLDRFCDRVDVGHPLGCWLWAGALNSSGYGQFRINGVRLTAHTAAYTLLRGPLPPGLVLDHLCRVRHCVNPDHLEPVTVSENIRRAWASGALRGARHKALGETCKRGHLRSEHSRRDVNGKLVCKACAREASLRWYHANKEEAA